MKTLHHLVTTFFLLMALTSCASATKPTKALKPTETIIPIQTIQPIQAVPPTNLAFSTPLVQALSNSGLSVMSVQSSTFAAIFPSTNKAVWIKTNEGILDAVFFNNDIETKQIHITEQPDKTGGRYLYTIQAPPPTLLHDQTINAAFPLYFTVSSEIFMVTSSEELDKTLKYIFSGR